MTAGRWRVLVVEDSLTVRRHIVDVLRADPRLVVAGECGSGREAIALCQALRPDVITLDMALPDIDGLAATEHIMAYTPTPILVVSSSTNRGDAFRTFDSLAAGAVDVIEKPEGNAFDATWEERLVARVKLVARIKVITHPRAKLLRAGGGPAPASVGAPADPAAPASPAAPAGTAAKAGGGLDIQEHLVRTLGTFRSTPPRLVAIGASTGGPAALAQLLGTLPADFAPPILVVIHVAQGFAQPLVDWLASQSRLPLALAHDGQPLPPVRPGVAGGVLIAPPDTHLAVEGERLVLSGAPERHSCRPSADVLLESVAAWHPGRAVGCILTGMGRDGAAGLLAMHAGGSITIAQDEASSMVFGMPRAAIELGAASLVLPLERIAGTLVRLSPRREAAREAQG